MAGESVTREGGWEARNQRGPTETGGGEKAGENERMKGKEPKGEERIVKRTERWPKREKI